MESETPSVAPSSLGINSKLDTPTNVFPSFHSFPQAASFNSSSSYQSTPYSSSLHYQSPNDLFDSSKNMPMNTQRSNIDNATLQTLQTRIIENNKLANASQQDKISSLTQSQAPGMSSGSVPVNGGPGTPSTNHQNYGVYDERFHALHEREMRWNEVRRCIDLIRRVATDAAHMDLTKESFYDLYNLALLLLKSVDSLDPDKNKKSESAQGYFPPQMSGGALTPSSSLILAQQLGMQPQSLTDADLLNQQRKSYDMYGMRSQSGNAFDGSTTYLGVPKYSALPNDQTLYAQYPQAEAYATNMQMGSGGFGQAQGGAFMKQAAAATPTSSQAEAKNFTGEVFFDDVGQGADGNRPKRRRRRTVYTSRRNLHCHMCGVTETPEWRRGPAGDHTLCNACGLHYAKSLKKQRKERDSRKHSIDMLLNEQQQPANPMPPPQQQQAQQQANAPLVNSPLNGNHSSPDSSQEDMTPPNDLLSPN